MDRDKANTAPRDGLLDSELSTLADRDGGIRREYAEIGLSPKSGWYSAILINFIGGLLLMGFTLFAPDLAPSIVGWFGALVLLNAGLAVVGLRVVGDADWGLYFRVAQSWAVFVGVGLVMGSGRIAFIWIPMLALTSVSSMYGIRRGVPFIVVAAVLAAGTALATDVTGNVALAVVMSFVMVVMGVSLLLVQTHVRGLARENRRLAETDDLTGVANMRSLRGRIAAELRHADPGSVKPFALFAIDLDEFKRVNDEFDYGTGDRVLQAVARELGDAAQENDLIVRRGGDEFSVLVPAAGGRNLDALARDFERAIGRARVAECPDVTPSGSVGYTVCSAGDQLPSVLARADDALHDAKVNFRNRAGATAINHGAAVEGWAPSPGTANRTGVARRFDGESQIRLVWRLASILFGSIAVLTAGLAAIAFDGGNAIVTGAIAAVLALIAVAAEFARSRAVPTALVKPAFACAVASVSGVVALSGDHLIATANLLPLLALYSFLLFGARLASVAAIVCVGAYVPLLISAEIAFTTITIVCLAFVVFMSVAIVAKVRSVTKRFILANLELSEKDALTGVANLRALRARISNAVNRGAESGTSVAVIGFDLDDFKAANERYSHTVGDSVLVATARALDESSRVDDLVARRGGDEFYVVAEGTAPEDIGRFADRMAVAILHARQRICPDLRPTASVAVATFEPGDDADTLLNKADLALHESKVEAHRLREMRMTA